MDIKGLPKLNQYCLDEQRDVQLAVWHFKYCPTKHRLELANNINKRLRTTGYKITCPVALKSYIDRNHVIEYLPDCDTDYMKLAEDVERYAKIIGVKLKKSIVSIVKGINTENIDSKVNELRSVLIDQNLLVQLEKSKDNIELTSFTEPLNILTRAVVAISKNINLLVCEKTVDHINNAVTNDIISTYAHIVTHNSRERTHLLIGVQKVIKCLYTLDITVTSNLIHTIALEWSRFGSSLLYPFFQTSTRHDTFNADVDIWTEQLWVCSETEKYLQQSIMEKYGKINSIHTGISTRPLIYSFDQYLIDNKLFKYEPVYNMLHKGIIGEFIDLFSFKLTEHQLFIIQETNVFDKLYQWVFCHDTCYVGIKNDKIYLLGRQSNDNTAFIAIDIDDCRKLLFRGPESKLNLQYETIKYSTCNSVLESSIEIEEHESITEGIDISANGEVTFSFSPKKTFMDQYAENHRMLVENEKNGNYEAMKTNLAFLFAMISVIERDYIYGKKKVKSSKLEDAKKARTFAYNDFNTYMRKLQKVEKGFDFTSYYHEKGYDTMIFTVSPDNIQGIKKLFNQVMLSQFIKV